MGQMTAELQRQHLNKVKTAINGDVVKAIESVFRVVNTEGKILDYEVAEPHKRLLRTGLLGDRSALFRIINKGRQGGFSIFQAVECSAIACAMPNTHQYYVATKEDQAKSWLKKVEDIAKHSRLNFDGSRIIDIDTSKSSQLEKVFRNKLNGIINESYVCGLAASPGGIRGESAIKVILDEFPQMIQRENQQKDVYTAIGYFIAQGGGCDIQGTPLVRSDKFWELYSNAKLFGMTPFNFPIIENWEILDLYKPLIIDLNDKPRDEVTKIMNLGIYEIRNNVLVNTKRLNNIACQRMIIPYKWYDWGFLEKKRAEDLSLFKQEVLGNPEDVVYRFVPPELWLPRTQYAQENLVGQSKYQYKMAIDPAQKRDVCAIVVGHRDEKNRVIEDFVCELQDTYPVQARKISELSSRYPTMNEVIIDNTGPGIGLADMLSEDRTLPYLRRMEFASTVEMDKRSEGDEKGKTISIHQLLALEFKKALNNEKYEAINFPVATAHVLRVERVVTDAFRVHYTGKRGGERDDHFWSKAMLNFAFTEQFGTPMARLGGSFMIGPMPDLSSSKESSPVIDTGGALCW